MPMQITGFNPTQGPEQTQVSLTLTGMPTDADEGNTNVFLSGDVVTDIISVTVDPQGNGSIDLTIGTNHQSGDFTVVVSSTNGLEHAESAAIFTVQHADPQRPTITSLTSTPNPPQAGANARITLRGTNLTDSTAVLVGSTRISVIQHAGSNQISFTLSSAVQAGRYRVACQSQAYGRVNCPTQLTVV